MIIRGSHRIVLYNTLQHHKKNLNFHLHLGEHAMDSNIINGVSNSVKNNMKQLELVLQNVLSSTKLRLEMSLVIHENVYLDVSRIFMWRLTPTLTLTVTVAVNSSN